MSKTARPAPDEDAETVLAAARPLGSKMANAPAAPNDGGFEKRAAPGEALGREDGLRQRWRVREAGHPGVRYPLMDTFTCSVTWDGEVHDVEVASPACAALVLEAFLGTRPGLRHLGLALFTAEGTELPDGPAGASR